MYNADLVADRAAAPAIVNYRPLLFGTELIPALLADRKTQTRRPVKLPRGPLPVAINPLRIDGAPVRGPRGRQTWRAAYDGQSPSDFYAPFAVDDVLWVRESWGLVFPEQIGDAAWRSFLAQRPHRIHPDGMAAAVYRADGDLDLVNGADGQRYRGWCPAIGMPFWASRIHLRVTAVRAQRVQDITRDECRAEGVFVPELRPGDDPANPEFPHYLGFRITWNRFYAGERGLPFETNPWAWVVEFTRIPAVMPLVGGAR